MSPLSMSMSHDFRSEVPEGFLEDVSVTFTDKTKGSDSTKWENVSGLKLLKLVHIMSPMFNTVFHFSTVQ